ncbi:GMP synthase domain-containing protein [Ilyonectria robusta]
MRFNECKEVKKTLQKHLGLNLTVVNSAELFLGRLKGVRKPEKKRKIIGETFVCPRTRSPSRFMPSAVLTGL